MDVMDITGGNMQILIILLIIVYIPLGVIFRLAGYDAKGRYRGRRRRRSW